MVESYPIYLSLLMLETVCLHSDEPLLDTEGPRGYLTNVGGEGVDVDLGEGGEAVNLGGEGEAVDLSGEGEAVNLGGEGVDVNIGEEGVDDNLGREGVDDNLGGEGESDFLSSDSDLDIPSEDEIPVGEAGGIDRGFEDIGKNKTDKYAGKLGGDEDYIDSSDCWSDDSDEQLDVDVVRGVDKPTRRRSKKVRYDEDCEVSIFELGMVFEGANQFRKVVADYAIEYKRQINIRGGALLNLQVKEIQANKVRTQSSQQSSVCADTTAVPRTTQTISTMGGPSHCTFKTTYATTQSSQSSFICADTESVPRRPQNRVQVGTGRGLGRKKANARGTPFVTESDSFSSQLPPLSGHKRPYNSASFAAATGGNRRPATGFGVYSNPTTGAQVFNPGTSSEKILHRPTKLKSASPTNIDIGFKPRGLKWKGKDAVSTSQLQQMKANRKN
ncbi:hypothetical protein KY290_023079 [Solanum tuberosum]|uniref:Transposon MuDR mudrA n=1 Tax=Solanum tuberosum TaxID=4113 RepID=A0ABQ7V6E9_SOLTU|nr:hypothetical protein KY284_022003 [Solanum tuberosum]KAH0684352.1 hypothetical protein KY289_022104 [Solanum tuberosum]KAH0694776.1 hypothetical protein KY285_021873 [Solanum tuberosum]KAH0759586.1 hypothetical protein KY290_023079 [Solanum tuberosum]